MNKDLELGKRIAWLRKYRNLKQIEVAKVLGIAYQSYQAYEYGSHPSRKNLELILNYYNCSRSWLLTGEGEPFPGARQKYPEVCGPPAQSGSPVPEPPLSGTVPATPYTQEFRISEALHMTARVLESGTSYATALYLNIKHFDRAIAAEARIAQIEQNQADLQAKNMSFEQQMQSIILEMKEEIRVLRNENTAMKAEINVLREENTALKEEIGILRKENAYLKEKLTKSDWPAGAAGEGTA